MIKLKVHLIKNDDFNGNAFEPGALGFHFLPALNPLDSVVFSLPRHQNRIDFAIIGAGEDIDIIIDRVHHIRAPFLDGGYKVTQ